MINTHTYTRTRHRTNTHKTATKKEKKHFFSLLINGSPTDAAWQDAAASARDETDATDASRLQSPRVGWCATDVARWPPAACSSGHETPWSSSDAARDGEAAAHGTARWPAAPSLPGASRAAGQPQQQRRWSAIYGGHASSVYAVPAVGRGVAGAAVLSATRCGGQRAGGADAVANCHGCPASICQVALSSSAAPPRRWLRWPLRGRLSIPDAAR